MGNDELKKAPSDPVKGLYVKIPKTSPEVFHQVDSVGETLYTSDLIITTCLQRKTAPCSISTKAYADYS